MPELELDTVYEVGEMLTVEAINDGSAISNRINGIAVVPNLSRQHEMENEIMSNFRDASPIEAVIQVELRSSESKKILKRVHDQNTHEMPKDLNKKDVHRSLNDDNLGDRPNTNEKKLKETTVCTSQSTLDNNSQENR